MSPLGCFRSSFYVAQRYAKTGPFVGVRTFRLDNASTTCHSRWVDDEYAYLLTIERRSLSQVRLVSLYDGQL